MGKVERFLNKIVKIFYFCLILCVYVIQIKVQCYIVDFNDLIFGVILSFYNLLYYEFFFQKGKMCIE